MSRDLLGAWFRDPARRHALRDEFAGTRAHPFPHVVIDDFLEDDIARRARADFPYTPGAPHTAQPLPWHVYCNPIEVKLSHSTPAQWAASLRGVLEDVLQHPSFLEALREITGIADLENDPFMHGGGLHCHPRGGKLDMHLDYGIHPLSGMERRLNLILYLVDDDWKDSFGGDLQLWNADLSACGRRVFPRFNRAILFRTSDISWHGMPDPLTCPADVVRRSMAIYYVTQPRPEATPRLKARFAARPSDAPDPEMDRLRAIRVHRRLTPEDTKKGDGDGGGDAQPWMPPWDACL